MPLNIALCTDRLGGVSETFIQAHVDGLGPGVTVVESSDFVPSVDGRPVLSQAVAARAARKLARLVRRQSWSREIDSAYAAAFRRADVVLAEYGETGVRVLPACREAGAPLVVHFHGYDATRRDVIERQRDAYALMFHEAAAVVAVSRRMRGDLLALGCPAEKVVVNPCSIDVDVFRATSPAENRPTLLAVGRLVEKKAPHLLLLALKEALHDAPDARLRLIGDGPLMGLCRGVAKALGIEHAVDFLGAQPHERVAREMAAARAFVQHSVTAPDGDAEGTPVAVLEALASGLPVVATRHAGIADAVVDGQTGYLVDEYDVQAMADRLVRVVADPAGAQRLGAAGRERVGRCYERRARLARLRAVLQAAADCQPIPYTDDDGLDPTPASQPAAEPQGALT